MSSPGLSREDITVGVELELFVKLENESMDKETGYMDSVIRDHLATHLSANPGNQNIAAELKKDSNVDWVLQDAPPGSLVPENEPTMRIYKWAGSGRPSSSPTDYFLVLEEELNGRWAASRPWGDKEITSPGFKLNEWDAELPALQSIISGLRSYELPIKVNRHCGMHIHVGVGDKMDLLLGRKVASIVTILELALLVPLTSPTRRNDVHVHQITIKSRMAVGSKANYGRSPSPLMSTFMDLVKARWNNRCPGRMLQQLCIIWMTDSLQSLRDVLYIPKETDEGQEEEFRGALAICLRDKTGKSVDKNAAGKANFESTPSTVEFRYPQMSVDPPQIKLWVRIAARIVEIAMVEREEFKRKFKELFNAVQESSNVPNDEHGWKGCEVVLTALGLADLISFCSEEFRRHAKGEWTRYLGAGHILLKK